MKDEPGSCSFSLVQYSKPKVICLEVGTSQDFQKRDSTSSSSYRSQTSSEVETILNTILPPKEFEEDGLVWRQQVSAKETNRRDVETLRSELDKLLASRQARDSGICQVRRELYAQCQDELIRQTTITCMERGLLLLRLRDESRMTLHAYTTLYESSTALGFKKSISIEQGKHEMFQKMRELEQGKFKLDDEIANLKIKIQMVEKKAKEEREVDRKQRKEELNFFKRTNQQLKSQIEAIMTPGK